jgi:acyl-CoA dehydrogenase
MTFHLGPRSLDTTATRLDTLAPEKLIPLAEPYRESNRLPRELISGMAEEGLFALNLPPSHGGSGLPYTATIAVHRERFGYFHPVCDAAYGLQTLGTGAIVHIGSPEQQDRYFPGLIGGDLVFAFGLTEPHSGSDVMSMKTTVRRDGDDWVLNGQKMFVSGSPDADAYVTFARSGEERNQVTAFIVEKGTPGFTPRGDLDVAARHPIGYLDFDECRVSDAQRLGPVHGGLGGSFGTLQSYRPSVGAFGVGVGRRAHDISLEFAKGRHSFGSKLADLDTIRARLGRIWAGVEAGGALVTRAAAMRDAGQSGEVEVAAAKLFATEHANRAAYDAQQIHGGRGVLVDSEPYYLSRHARAAAIYEGSSEVQRFIIGRAELRRQATGSSIVRDGDGLLAWARRGYETWLTAYSAIPGADQRQQRIGTLCTTLLAAEATADDDRRDGAASWLASCESLATEAAMEVLAALTELPESREVDAAAAEGLAAVRAAGRSRDDLALAVAAARMDED